MSPPGNSQTSAETGGIFPRTRWSMVIAARDSLDVAHSAALEDLCQLYWRPVYFFIRGRGNGPTESEDLTQEFFYRLVSGQYLKAVDGPERGRLRSFLCVVLKRFLADEYAKSRTQRRGGKWQAISIDRPSAEALIAATKPSQDSPDIEFDRHWALDLLGHAMQSLSERYAAAGKGELFEKLKPTISLHLESLPYAALGAELGMKEGAVKVAVHRLRQRYRECLEAMLHDTLADPEDVEDEHRYLLSLFAGH